MKLNSLYSIIIAVFITATVVFSSCKKTKEEYAIDKLVPEKAQQDSLLLRIVTIIEEHMPDSVEKADRFKPEQQAFFKEEIKKYKFECLYKKDADYYYYITKPAYGVPELVVGLAGKFKLDAKNNLTDFEESYRLFRMPAVDLDRKGIEVYDAFIHGKDLTPFHKDLNEDPYIEFPNDHVAYDKQKLDWYFIKSY